MFDVIVIGAGPAGCTASKILAYKGYNVLLVEKFKMPRYKSCSGVLIKKSMDLVNLYFNETTPDFTMCEPTQNKGMIFTSDDGKEYCFEQPGLNIWRHTFDNWLATKSKESGTHIRDSTTAISYEEQDEYVTVTLQCDGKVYTENAKYIINCEGVVGSLKRKSYDNTKDYITTFQTFNKGVIDLDYHYFYAYLQQELSQYDAWFNVKDNLLVLGVSVKDTSKINHYYNIFLSYMKHNHNLSIDEQVKSEKWIMPHIHPKCRVDYGASRVLFSGEIAGFLNPMGEGISSALESGYCAANSISAHFNNPSLVHNTYKVETEKLKIYMERQWNFVANIATPFNHMKL